jgi:hypothetical protein
MLPNDRADRPISTLNSVYQVGPPVASATNVRVVPSADLKKSA